MAIGLVTNRRLVVSRVRKVSNRHHAISCSHNDFQGKLHLHKKKKIKWSGKP